MFDKTLHDVATKLVAYCQEGREAEGLDTLYAPNAVSIEAAELADGGGREAKGLDAIRAKHAWWDKNIEVHSFSADGPYLHGDDRFAVIFDAAFTMKATGERTEMKEVAIYSIANGKIVREEFYNRP